MLVNKSQNKMLDTVYLAYDCKPEDIPTGPPSGIVGDPTLERFVQKLQVTMEKRPMWTRRGLQNQVAREPGLYMLKQAMQYIGYQFKSGPFRDVVIKFGVDPRTDKSFRIYQTLWFKLYDKDEPAKGDTWHDKRSEYIKRRMDPSLDQTHIFDGTKVELDGKIWQICDVTDPLLVGLINQVQLRSEYEPQTDGWYCNGSFAKIKAIMKTKLLALLANRPMEDEEFDEALAYPDVVEGRISRDINVPVPDMRITQEEAEELRALGIEGGIKGRGVKKEHTKRADWARRRREARMAADAAMVREFGEKTTSTTMMVGGQGGVDVDGDVLVMDKAVRDKEVVGKKEGKKRGPYKKTMKKRMVQETEMGGGEVGGWWSSR